MTNPTSQIVANELKKTNAYASRRLKLVEPHHSFTSRVLADFDRLHAPKILQEGRVLSGAEVGSHNTFLPASFQREVIRESLANLNVLELLNTGTDPSATVTVDIPYEERSQGLLPNDGIVFEGQGIPFSGVSLKADVAYITPMKLAMKVTNEIIHLSTASQMNWDAWADNISANARVIRELIHFRVVNEMQRASDSFNAKDIVNEAATADDSGLIKTAHFPIVRPYHARTLTGQLVGNPENPLSIVIDGGQVNYFTGYKDAAPGIYWRFSNINLGYIQLVDETGAIAGAGKNAVISYSYATNLIKFDLDAPEGVKYSTHLNDLLAGIGDQKAMLGSSRYAMPDYQLMSGLLHNELTKADQFIVSLQRNGTATNLVGDLETIKGLPAFATNAPGDIGENRIILGQRGLTSYIIAKPFKIGETFEAVNNKGQMTGEKMAYGEEYNAIYTPKPVRSRYTSILVFSSSKR